MSHPFQCLYTCLGKVHGKYDILFAASGSYINCFDITSEKLVSVWTSQEAQEHSLEKAVDADAQEPKNASSNEMAYLDSIRPSKRQKVSLSEGSSADPLFEDDHNLKTEQPKDPRPPGAIIKLIGTHDGRYIIVVTDDKCIRVLEFLPDNSLKQLSERYTSTFQIFTEREH